MHTHDIQKVLGNGKTLVFEIPELFSSAIISCELPKVLNEEAWIDRLSSWMISMNTQNGIRLGVS